MPKRFVITGCGRSATTYMARVLSDIGCECSHEAYFTKAFNRIDRWLAALRLKELKWKMPPLGESSWKAVPFLRYLPKDTIVFHQVRDPLGYIRSRQQKGLVDFPVRRRAVRIKVGAKDKASFGNLPVEKQVEYLAEFWLRWNRLAEENAEGMRYVRYRTDQINADLICRILDLVEFRHERKTVEDICNNIPPTVHGGKTKTVEISLDMLPRDLHARVKDLAERYGFAV